MPIKRSAYIAASQENNQKIAAPMRGYLLNNSYNRSKEIAATATSVTAVTEYSAESKNEAGKPMRSPGRTTLIICRRPLCSAPYLIAVPSTSVNSALYL